MTLIRVILRNCFYITEVTWDIYMTTKRKRVRSSLYHFPPRLPLVCLVSSGATWLLLLAFIVAQISFSFPRSNLLRCTLAPARRQLFQLGAMPPYGMKVNINMTHKPRPLFDHYAHESQLAERSPLRYPDIDQSRSRESKWAKSTMSSADVEVLVRRCILEG